MRINHVHLQTPIPIKSKQVGSLTARYLQFGKLVQTIGYQPYCTLSHGKLLFVAFAFERYYTGHSLLHTANMSLIIVKAIHPVRHTQVHTGGAYCTSPALVGSVASGVSKDLFRIEGRKAHIK